MNPSREMSICMKYTEGRFLWVKSMESPRNWKERAAASTASIFMKEAGVREVLRMNLRMLRAITIPKGYPIPGMRVIFRR